MRIAHIHVWDTDNKGDVAIVQAVQELLHEHFGAVTFIDFPIEFLREATQADVERLNSCDIAVIGGGGIYYRYFAPFQPSIIDQIRIPIVLFGVGYIREVGSQALSRQGIAGIVHLNKRAALTSVRDHYSKQFLVRHGVHAENIAVIGDPAIFLTEKVTNDVPLHGGSVRIGFNLNYSGWLGFGQHRDAIVNAYRAVAHYFQQEHDADIYYLQHHPGEENIVSALNLNSMQVVDLKPQEQKWVYGQLDIVVGMMLHACVLAFGAGTPEINVVYDIRNRNFARFIHHTELAVELEELVQGVLLERAQHVFDQRSQYRQSFLLIKERIWKKQKAFINRIKQL